MPESSLPAAGAEAGRASDPVADTGFQPRWFRSQDDLLLYGRDYGLPPRACPSYASAA